MTIRFTTLPLSRSRALPCKLHGVIAIGDTREQLKDRLETQFSEAEPSRPFAPDQDGFPVCNTTV